MLENQKIQQIIDHLAEAAKNVSHNTTPLKIFLKKPNMSSKKSKMMMMIMRKDV